MQSAAVASPIRPDYRLAVKIAYAFLVVFGGKAMMLRSLVVAGAVLLSASASAAEREVSCVIKQVMQTRYGVLINCEDAIQDKGLNGTDSVDWFAPDARLTKNQNGNAPELTVGETMLSFQQMALEAQRSKRPLRVMFQEGSRPGGLFDCLNFNCRLARVWTLRN